MQELWLATLLERVNCKNFKVNLKYSFLLFLLLVNFCCAIENESVLSGWYNQASSDAPKFVQYDQILSILSEKLFSCSDLA